MAESKRKTAVGGVKKKSKARSKTKSAAAAKTKRSARQPRFKWSQAVADEICARLASGMSLIKICQLKSMPSATTVRKQLSQDAAFALQYARAREEQADHYADEIADIADDTKLHYNDKRIRIDARKWIASKLKPKKYGDSIDVTSKGERLNTLPKITMTNARGETTTVE